MSEHHPAVNYMFSPVRRERVETGGEIDGDPDTACLCMPIKYWFLPLAVVHFALAITSIFVGFMFCRFLVFDSFLVLFSLLIICCPDTFAVFVHYLLQAVFWFICFVLYIVHLIMEAKEEAHAGRITILSLHIITTLIFLILFLRLVISGR